MSSLNYMELCRLCLVKERVSIPIFEGEGDVRQIFLKIASCLPVKTAGVQWLVVRLVGSLFLLNLSLSAVDSWFRSDGADVYNVDETGLAMVNKGGKIVAPKGSKTVAMRKSGERSENITLVVSSNATASIILPPMVIYKGSRYDFCKVLAPAWQTAITPANILGGFRGSGVWPLDPFAVHSHRLMDSGPNGPAPASTRPDDEPQPGCSFNGTPISPISPVVQVIRELLTPEEDSGKHSRRITTTRCVTSLDFLREMEEKENKPAKRVEISSEQSETDNENGDNTCGECGGAFEDDFRGESWVQCTK
ncbi:hypothetical protein C0J52_06185 [Blattella germanica]|nr:hypothetical protein C0J52_06185 [Blattella germanica]